MADGLEYPRVLIISRTELTEFNSEGAAIGGWLHNWPKDRLAHMYSVTMESVTPMCGHHFLLTGRERRWGWLFNRLKSAAGNDDSLSAAGARASGGKASPAASLGAPCGDSAGNGW